MRISTLVTVANATNANELTLGYEKRTKEFLMTVLEVILRVNKNQKRLNQSRESEMYQLTVKWGLELIPHYAIDQKQC